MTESDEPSALAERIARSVRSTLEDDGRSRRSFLNRSALAGGALLAAGGSTGFVMAQDDDEGDGMTAEDIEATFDDVEGTDLDVLNYALTLERLEDAFYRQATEQFDETAFMESEALSDFSEERRTEVFEYVQTAGEHESAHVAVLTQAAGVLGGDPNAATAPDNGTAGDDTATDTPAGGGTYDFGLESVGDVLELGRVLENTGVAAYAGAAPYIESPDLLSAALAIHSVEARHAATFNQITGESPFPNAFDPAASQEEVLDAVSPFISGAGNGTDDGMGDETETPTETETETETETPTETDTGA